MAVNCWTLQKGFGFNTTSLWTGKPQCMQSRVITSDSIQICNTELPSVSVALTISTTDLCCCFCGAHNLTYWLESGSERWLHDHSWRKRADIVLCFFHWGDFFFKFLALFLGLASQLCTIRETLYWHMTNVSVRMLVLMSPVASFFTSCSHPHLHTYKIITYQWQVGDIL